MSKSLLEFAYGVPYDVFAYNSRVGTSVSYWSVCKHLKDLSEEEAQIVFNVGRDPGRGVVIVMDNVQNFHLQRDPRIGRENTMNVGLAATLIEIDGVDPRAFSLDDKRLRLMNSEREALTVGRLLSFINGPHIETVCGLHWLRTLVNYIPSLSHLKEQVSMLFWTRAQKFQLPIKANKVHPLATSSNNETVNTELKDALMDFLSQIGHAENDYPRQLILASGDGMTYEKILQLKKYLQFHEDDLLSLNLLEPVLALWHTMWTDLSRIFETHWGESLSTDPSTLSYSAAKIGRPQPANLKKVDYYPHSELAYLILDIRMLDCWRCV